MKLLRRISRNLRKITHESTAFMRLMPDFFITGSSRTGKTTLLNYLTQHPQIFRSYMIETSYFDLNYNLGIRWYKSNFPTRMQLHYSKFMTNDEFHIGESVHIHSPFVPERIHEIISNPKIVILLRNPIDRAYSYYQKSVEIGKEQFSFEEALQKEEERFQQDQKTLDISPVYYENFRQWYLYKTTGIYINFLKNWVKFFPKKNMLFLKTEDLFSNPSLTVNHVLSFLNLKHLKNLKIQNHSNKQNIASIKPATREELAEYFKPNNLELYQYIGKNLGWEEDIS